MTPSCKRTCHLRRIRELDMRMNLYRDFRLSAVQAIHKYAEESSNSEKLISTNSQMKIELLVIAGAIACDLPGCDCYARGTFFSSRGSHTRPSGQPRSQGSLLPAPWGG